MTGIQNSVASVEPDNATLAFLQVPKSIPTIQNTMIWTCMNSFHTHRERTDKLLCSIGVGGHFIRVWKEPSQDTQEIIETTF